MGSPEQSGGDSTPKKTGLTLDDVRVTYDTDSSEARPAVVIEDARNVSILGASATRGAGLDYDIGLRRTPVSEVRAPGMVVKPLD